MMMTMIMMMSKTIRRRQQCGPDPGQQMTQRILLVCECSRPEVRRLGHSRSTTYSILIINFVISVRQSFYVLLIRRWNAYYDETRHTNHFRIAAQKECANLHVANTRSTISFTRTRTCYVIYNIRSLYYTFSNSGCSLSVFSIVREKLVTFNQRCADRT